LHLATKSSWLSWFYWSDHLCSLSSGFNANGFRSGDQEITEPRCNKLTCAAATLRDVFEMRAANADAIGHIDVVEAAPPHLAPKGFLNA
jgi:hypothetical protein